MRLHGTYNLGPPQAPTVDTTAYFCEGSNKIEYAITLASDRTALHVEKPCMIANVCLYVYLPCGICISILNVYVQAMNGQSQSRNYSLCFLYQHQLHITPPFVSSILNTCYAAFVLKLTDKVGIKLCVTDFRLRGINTWELQ